MIPIDSTKAHVRFNTREFEKEPDRPGVALPYKSEFFALLTKFFCTSDLGSSAIRCTATALVVVGYIGVCDPTLSPCNQSARQHPRCVSASRLSCMGMAHRVWRAYEDRSGKARRSGDLDRQTPCIMATFDVPRGFRSTTSPFDLDCTRLVLSIRSAYVAGHVSWSVAS